MKNILLTGGNGFIGRNIKEQLGEKYNIYSPSSSQLDLLDSIAIKYYIKKYNITNVIHAAVYNQKRRNLNSNADLDSNLKMFFNLAEIADDLEKIIYFGSGAEFDKRFPIHMAIEDDIGKRIPMLNDYALSKYLMNLEARRSKNIYNMRLFGVYGKYEDENCFPTHLCKCAIEGRPLTIRQECLFDFLYIDDLMQPLEWILNNIPKYHDYNICNEKPIYLSEMAHIVKDISGKNLDTIFLNPGENLEYTANNIRSKVEFDYNLTCNQIALQKLYYNIEVNIK